MLVSVPARVWATRQSSDEACVCVFVAFTRALAPCVHVCAHAHAYWPILEHEDTARVHFWCVCACVRACAYARACRCVDTRAGAHVHIPA